MTKVQIARSSLPGARPANGSQPVGSLYVNFADKMLGVIDPAGNPIDLLDGPAPVTSVNTKVGAVVLTAADVGAAATAHTHTIADVTNLQTTLDGKAATVHSHVIADVTNLQTTLDGKAPIAHSHVIADVSQLQTTLDGKVAKTGDTMLGDLQIKKVTPKLSLHHPDNLIWDFYIDAADGGVKNDDGRWIWYSNNADFFVPGNLVAYWSDARLKEAVRDLDGYEDRIMGLRPVSFAWNKKGRELTNRKYREREIGFIAQEARSVSDHYVAENPVARTEEGDAYLTVQKDEMIADLVATVKSLVIRVRELEDKVNGGV